MNGGAVGVITAERPGLWHVSHLVVVGAVLLLAALPLASGRYEDADSQQAFAVGSGAAVIALLLYTHYGLGFAWLSATGLYLAMFWMFHFGLSFVAALVPDVLTDYYQPEIAWLFQPNGRLAMMLGVIGATGFVCGAGLFGPPATVVDRSRRHHPGDPTLHRAGWMLMLLGMTAAVALLLQRGGLGIFSMGYLPFRVNVLEASLAPLAIDASQLGCAFAICGAPRDRCLRPAVVWSVLGALMLVLGLRSETLIPLVTFLILFRYRGVRLRSWMVAAAAATLLFVIPGVRTVRLAGIGNAAPVTWRDASPLGTFTELGGTLRAAKAHVDWIEQGDAYQLGATYWAPFDRQVLSRVVPGHTVVPRADDPRLPSRNISLEGAVGLSATGEAYYNFSVAGPFIFYALVGALFAALERQAHRTPHRAVLLAIVMLVMLFNIRGEWLPVPARLGLGAGLLWTCHLLGRPQRDSPPIGLVPWRPR